MTVIKQPKRRSVLIITVVLLTIASLITVWVWDTKEKQCLEREYHEMLNKNK